MDMEGVFSFFSAVGLQPVLFVKEKAHRIANGNEYLTLIKLAVGAR